MARSRGGCPNCKRRKKKCDETRPACHACTHRGDQCDGYAATIRWANGIASRGRFAGVGVPDALVTKSSGHDRTDDLPSSTPAHSHQTIPSSQAQDERQQLFLKCKNPSYHLPMAVHTEVANLSVLHVGLLRLYATQSCSWIRGFFADMAKESPAIVVICAAIQGYLDDGRRQLSVASMERIDLALQTFRRELSDCNGTMHAATVSAGLLVCSLCVSNLSAPR